MSMFSDKDKTVKTNEPTLEQLKNQLSATQLKVARQNYRVSMQSLSVVMDITSNEVKQMLSRKVIERVLAYSM